MAKWEITIGPSEVEQAVRDYIRAKYDIPDEVLIEAVNEWPYVDIKMGKYPPTNSAD